MRREAEAVVAYCAAQSLPIEKPAELARFAAGLVTLVSDLQDALMTVRCEYCNEHPESCRCPRVQVGDGPWIKRKAIEINIPTRDSHHYGSPRSSMTGPPILIVTPPLAVKAGEPVMIRIRRGIEGQSLLVNGAVLQQYSSSATVFVCESVTEESAE